jgi:hypothetical protein
MEYDDDDIDDDHHDVFLDGLENKPGVEDLYIG